MIFIFEIQFEHFMVEQFDDKRTKQTCMFTHSNTRHLCNRIQASWICIHTGSTTKQLLIGCAIKTNAQRRLSSFNGNRNSDQDETIVFRADPPGDSLSGRLMNCAAHHQLQLPGRRPKWIVCRDDVKNHPVSHRSANPILAAWLPSPNNKTQNNNRYQIYHTA